MTSPLSLVIVQLHALNDLSMLCRTCSGVDVYTAMAAGVGALHGPLHGGASEAVVGMLQAIGTPDNVPRFLQQVSYLTPHKIGVS
jgi:citrate synthase